MIYRCIECNKAAFAIMSESGKWVAVYFQCNSSYRLMPDGTIQLLELKK